MSTILTKLREMYEATRQWPAPRKTTLDELEALLNGGADQPLTLLPDGTIKEFPGPSDNYISQLEVEYFALKQWAERAVNHIESTKYHYAGLSNEMTQCERLLNDPTAIEIRVEHNDIKVAE